MGIMNINSGNDSGNYSGNETDVEFPRSPVTPMNNEFERLEQFEEEQEEEPEEEQEEEEEKEEKQQRNRPRPNLDGNVQQNDSLIPIQLRNTPTRVEHSQTPLGSPSHKQVRKRKTNMPPVDPKEAPPKKRRGVENV